MTVMTPKLSVIIPARDSARTIQACLEALLLQQGYIFGQDYEVILVDDGSQDNTAQIAEQLGVRVICQPNAGPATARNTGVEHARGELIFFTDSDCIPNSDWLSRMAAPFADPTVVGVKGTYLCEEKNAVARFVQQEFEYKYRSLEKLTRIDFIDTYSAAYRKSIFIENGGFDARFPVPSVEDQEFSFRLSRKGYHLVFQPSAHVYHRHDLNLKQYIQRKWGIHAALVAGKDPLRQLYTRFATSSNRIAGSLAPCDHWKLLLSTSDLDHDIHISVLPDHCLTLPENGLAKRPFHYNPNHPFVIVTGSSFGVWFAGRLSLPAASHVASTHGSELYRALLQTFA